MSTCPKCGIAMRPLFIGEFCPNDCDRPVTPSSFFDRSDKPWMRYDTGHCIAVKDEEGGSYYVYYYTLADVLVDAPMPASSRNLRGWWIGQDDSVDVKSALKLLTDHTNNSILPGWSFETNGAPATDKYIRSEAKRGNIGVGVIGVLVLAWVEE